MRQFVTVFKFEFFGRIKSRAYIGVTVSLAAILLAMACLPLISGLFGSLFGGGDGDEAAGGPLETAAFYDATGLYTADLIALYDPGYDWVQADSAADLEPGIDRGDYALALDIDMGALTLYVRGSEAMYIGDSVYAEMAKAVTQGAVMADAGLTEAEIGAVLTAEPQVEYVTVGRDTSQSLFISLAVVVLLYIAIAFYGQSVSSSVSTEKTSKAMELLTISASPYSLMFGKIIGTGLAGLLQLAVILLPSGVALYAIMDTWMEYSPMVGSMLELLYSSGALGYALVFFLLSFFTFAFLYGAMASTISRAEDLSGSQMIPMLLLMAAYIASVMGLYTPDALYIKVLSYVPFFSPLVMFMRICLTDVAPVEILLSIGASVVYVLLLGWLTAKIYRVGVMLYGNRPSLVRLFKLMREA